MKRRDFIMTGAAVVPVVIAGAEPSQAIPVSRRSDVAEELRYYLERAQNELKRLPVDLPDGPELRITGQRMISEEAAKVIHRHWPEIRESAAKRLRNMIEEYPAAIKMLEGAA